MNTFRSGVVVAGFLVATLFTGVLFPAAPPSAAASKEKGTAQECLLIAGLAKADPLADERRPDGRVIEETTLVDGSSVPVLMIHGFTGRSEHRAERDGNFSAAIDLTAVPGQSIDPTWSMIGQTQDIGGTSVYTFDYHDVSARWVTDPVIAPALTDAISCLSEAHGHPVIAVAHSMGGLALRQALASLEGQEVAGVVSDVITLGTPNLGSWAAAAVNGATSIAALFPGAPGTTLAALRSILLLCGQASTRSLENGNLCAGLSEQFAGFDSEAGRALRVGSEEMDALPAWPAAVEVHALAGDIGLDVTNFSWFGATRDGGRLGIGDLVVTLGSAVDRSDEISTVACEYTLNFTSAATDNLLEAVRLRASSETRDNLLTNFGGSPCYHGNLMRTIELANSELGIIAGRMDAISAQSFFVGDTEFVRLEPWSTSEASKPLEGVMDFSEDCYQAASYRQDFLHCSAGVQCFLSPSQDEALCGGSLGSLSRVRAVNASAALRGDFVWEKDRSPIAQITPIEFETVDGDACRPRWTGTGLFGPPPYGVNAADCQSTEDRDGGATAITWGVVDESNQYGVFFLRPNQTGKLRAALTTVQELDANAPINDEYSGPVRLVDIAAVYY